MTLSSLFKMQKPHSQVTANAAGVKKLTSRKHGLCSIKPTRLADGLGKWNFPHRNRCFAPKSWFPRAGPECFRLRPISCQKSEYTPLLRHLQPRSTGLSANMYVWPEFRVGLGLPQNFTRDGCGVPLAEQYIPCKVHYRIAFAPAEINMRDLSGTVAHVQQ